MVSYIASFLLHFHTVLFWKYHRRMLVHAYPLNTPLPLTTTTTTTTTITIKGELTPASHDCITQWKSDYAPHVDVKGYLLLSERVGLCLFTSIFSLQLNEKLLASPWYRGQVLQGEKFFTFVFFCRSHIGYDAGAVTLITLNMHKTASANITFAHELKGRTLHQYLLTPYGSEGMTAS